jgi:hypothetical protein
MVRHCLAPVLFFLSSRTRFDVFVFSSLRRVYSQSVLMRWVGGDMRGRVFAYDMGAMTLGTVLLAHNCAILKAAM